MLKTKATYNLDEMTNQDIIKTTKNRLDAMQLMIMSGRMEDANELLCQAYNCLEQLGINHKE